MYMLRTPKKTRSASPARGACQYTCLLTMSVQTLSHRACSPAVQKALFTFTPALHSRASSSCCDARRLYSPLVSSMDDAAFVAAKDAVLQRLDEPERTAYWEAFSRFLRFEISQPEFDSAARKALGANVALHNALVWALLRSAVCSSRSTIEEADSSMLYPESMYVSHSASEPKRLRSEFGSEFAPLGADGLSLTPPDDSWGASSFGGEAAPAAPLLSLKIKKNESGVFAAEVGVKQLEVDAAEEAQVPPRGSRLVAPRRALALPPPRPRSGTPAWPPSPTPNADRIVARATRLTLASPLPRARSSTRCSIGCSILRSSTASLPFSRKRSASCRLRSRLRSTACWRAARA